MVLISQIFEFISSNWLIVAFLAPMSWALVNIIDVYFVEEIYRDEVDGTIISGIFQILPWIIIFPLFNINISDYFSINFGYYSSNKMQFSFFMHDSLLYSLMGGLLFSLVFYFYYRALFRQNDVSLVEIFNNLSVVIIPFVAYIFFREKLSFIGYVGMGITLLGAMMLMGDSIVKKNISFSLLSTMFACALFLSLSLVFEEHAYSILNVQGLDNSGFWAGFFFFSLGVFVGSIIFAVVHSRNILPILRKYTYVFIIAEGISFLGTLFMQRALDIGPSASFVVTIETFVPAFVLLYSIIIVCAFHISKRSEKIGQILPNLYKMQLKKLVPKILSIVIMGIGVYIFNL